MEVNISFDVAIVIAVILGELVSVIWFSDNTPWGRRGGDRYLLSALAADVGLALLLRIIMRNYWSVRKWEDAAFLGVWLSLVYACLEGPHAVWNARTFSSFFFHTLHKAVVIFVMAFSLFYFKDFKF